MMRPLIAEARIAWARASVGLDVIGMRGDLRLVRASARLAIAQLQPDQFRPVGRHRNRPLDELRWIGRRGLSGRALILGHLRQMGQQRGGGIAAGGRNQAGPPELVAV